jgi:2-polyprenyl-3-methyl-5-hydroxy-6-metoxy-1,4-benzoquinol methylase
VFHDRYAQSEKDAWGYLGSAAHEQRCRLILELLPQASSETALEVGCAVGFITKSLAQRFGRVIACDLSDIAIDRARRYCGDALNVEFHAQDIRSGIPAHDVQVCLVSDVLYYLSPREISSFAIELASRMNPSGQMVFVNEWNKSYRDLTHPEKACQVILNTGRWTRLSFAKKAVNENGCLWVGVFEVTKG